MATTDTRFDPPPYMEKGSEGPVVNIVLQFLMAWAKKNRMGHTGIALDGKLGPIGIRWIKTYQRENGLQADGGWGPKTRDQAKKDGFDFVATAKAQGEVLTAFVQPDGTTLHWAEGTAADKSSSKAAGNLRTGHIY